MNRIDKVWFFCSFPEFYYLSFRILTTGVHENPLERRTDESPSHDIRERTHT